MMVSTAETYFATVSRGAQGGIWGFPWNRRRRGFSATPAPDILTNLHAATHPDLPVLGGAKEPRRVQATVQVRDV